MCIADHPIMFVEIFLIKSDSWLYFGHEEKLGFSPVIHLTKDILPYCKNNNNNHIHELTGDALNTYKSLLCLWTSPYPWGARVRVAGSIGTHPRFSSLAIWGSPLVLSHSAQTTYSSQSSVAGQARVLWSILRAPGPSCHGWRKNRRRDI